MARLQIHNCVITADIRCLAADTPRYLECRGGNARRAVTAFSIVINKVMEVQMVSHSHSADRSQAAGKQRGQGMSEYIIITALIAVAGIGLFAAFGDTLQNQIAGMSQEMAGQSGATDIQQAATTATTARTRAAQAESLSNYNQQTGAGGG